MHEDRFFFIKLTFLVTPIKITFYLPSYRLMAMMPCHSQTVIRNGARNKTVRHYHAELNERTGAVTIEQKNVKLKATDIDSGWMEADFR